MTEGRIFLGQLGIERRQLLEIFDAAGVDRAVEELGLAPEDVALVSTTALTNALYGLQPTLSFVDPLNPSAPPATHGYIVYLHYAKYFLLQSGLTQEQLLELLKSRLAEALGGITLTWPGSDCNLDRATLDNLDEKKALALHNLVRLSRRAQLSLRELDAFADTRAPAAAFTTQALDELGRVSRIARRLGCTFLDALALWAPLDTKSGADDTPSQYAQTFLGIRVAAPERAPFELQANGRQLAAIGSISALAATIGGAVGLGIDDIERLKAAGKIDDRLNLVNLSTLAAVAILCRGLQLKVSELLSLSVLVKEDPLTPAGTEAFLDRVDLIRSSGLSVAELDYLIRHRPAAPTGIAPAEAATVAVLTAIRDGLRVIATKMGDAGASVAPPEDPKHVRLSTALQTLLVQSDVADLLVLLDNFSDGSLFAPRQDLLGRLAAVLDPSGALALASALSADLVNAGGTVAHPSPNITDLGKRATRLFEAIAASQRRTLILDKLASTLSLDDQLTSELLQTRINAFALNAKSFVDPAPVARGVDYDAWFTAHLWLSKVSLLMRRLQLTPADVRAWRKLEPAGGWLSLDHLPTDATVVPNPSAAFDSLADALEVLAVRPWVQPGQESLPSFLARVSGLSISAAFDSLETMTGATSGTLVAAGLALGVSAAATLRDGRKLGRLQLLSDLTIQTGVSPSDLKSWAGSTLTLDQARAIRGAVKAKVPADEWGGTAKPLQDRLREAQRNALLAYICARDQITPKDLTEHLVIDVEMSACQLTSRIRQALNSVQLFVQRVSLGLEFRGPATAPIALFLDQDHQSQWRQWMRTYVSWREARILFLYPESYLDLSLRDDKSPFFADFEKALTKGEITRVVVEDAFRDYLTKVDQVGLLEVMSIYEDYHPPASLNARLRGITTEPTTLHVFARTRGTPNIYFYRSLVADAGWTPWEKLDLDISGDHLVPVVYDRTLYLFWVIFHEKQEEPVFETDSKKPPRAQWKHFDLELAWSERKAGKWTSKRAGRQRIETAPGITLDAGNYTFHAAVVRDVWAAMGKPAGLASYQDDLCILCREINLPLWGWPSGQIGWWVMPTCGGDSPVEDVTTDWGAPNRWLPITPTTEVGMRNVFDPTQSWQGLELINMTGISWLPADADLFDNNPEPYTLAHTTAIDSSSNPFKSPPFIFQDGHQSYALLDNRPGYQISPAILDLADPASVLAGTVPPSRTPYDAATKVDSIFAQTFFHPYACEFLRRLHHGGFDELFLPGTQTLSEDDFASRYSPGDALAKDYPKLQVEFAVGEAFSLHNWETFLWGPLRIAQLFARANRFEDALAWYHRVYDPRDPLVAAKPVEAWRFLPFKTRDELDLTDLLALLDYSGTDAKLRRARVLMQVAVSDWREHPFEPFRIARHRPSALMRMVTIDYVELLIAYGDFMLREDNIESVNYATQLYLWALTLVGKQPEKHAPRGQIPPKTYEDLRKAPLDAFSNALVKLEGFVPTAPPKPSKVPIPIGYSFYFCVPPNTKLVELWDTLDDRLFKIRHCQNIDGVYRQLALFGSSLDPSVLLAANAAGLDLKTLLSDSHTPLPIYRFPVLLQKAMEVANELKSFGGSLLGAIEKRDSELLALLRQRHERALLDAVRKVKERQRDEAQANLDALERGRDIAQAKSDYYGSRPFMNESEKANIGLATAGAILTEAAVVNDLTASILAWVPDFQVGIQGIGATPTATATTGGSGYSTASGMAGSALRGIAGGLSAAAAISQTIGSFQRRADDWQFQKGLADLELEQINQQIAAANIRIQIADQELDNQDLQITNAREIDDYFHSKFSSAELYDRMVQTLTSLHGRLRNVALDLAARAQNSYRFERVDPAATFIQSSRVVGLKAKLLAGDSLVADLREMEAAYLDSNQRELELTRHISLITDFPSAYLQLRSDGMCDVEMDEDYFDRQMAGLYMRRIKTVALTIACTVGPNEPVHAKLTLVKSRVRRDASLATGYTESAGGADLRFRYDRAPIGPIVTSNAVNDNGMFEANNFRDERLLWMEGAGAVGTYRIELPTDRTDVDLTTISDVTLHLRYTARDGGKTLANAVPARAKAGKTFFTARTDFADAWEVFSSTTGLTRTLVLALDPNRFPPRNRAGLNISAMAVFWKGGGVPGLTIKKPSGASVTASVVNALPLVSAGIADGPGVYELTFATGALPEDIGILVDY